MRSRRAAVRCASPPGTSPSPHRCRSAIAPTLRIVGVGPATIVRSTTGETVFHFIDSDDVEVEHLAVRTVSAGPPPGEESLNGAITFEGCRGVTVRSVHASIPDGPVRTQTAITVRAAGDPGAGAGDDQWQPTRRRVVAGGGPRGQRARRDDRPQPRVPRRCAGRRGRAVPGPQHLRRRAHPALRRLDGRSVAGDAAGAAADGTHRQPRGAAHRWYHSSTCGSVPVP